MCFNTFEIQKKYYKEIAVIKGNSLPIFFIGMMGSGKSTIGKCISQILGYTFFEMDSIIEKRLGISINNIFQEYGEDFFRKEESLLLHEICNTRKSVIACGGGVFAKEENIDVINKSGISVFLNVSSSVLKGRLRSDEQRPLLKTNSINNILLKRIPLYTQAHIMVDIINTNLEKNIGQVMEEIYKYTI